MTIVDSTPRISTLRPGQAPRASGNPEQGGKVSWCPITNEVAPELPGFPSEISNHLVWFESLPCIKVGEQGHSSWSESQHG